MNYNTLRSAALVVLLLVSTIGFVGSAGAATSTDVSLTPTDKIVSPGETVTYEVTVGTVDNGIQSYELDVAVNNTAVANITGVELVGTDAGSAGASVDIADDGSNVSLSAASGSHDNGVIARINVTGRSVGRASLTLSNVVVGDTNFSSYTITATTDATATVGTATEITAQQKTLRPNKSASLRISLSNPVDGVGSYEFTATVGNTSVATISSIKLTGANQSDAGTTVNISNDNSTVSVATATGDHSKGVIATITLQTHALGSTTMSLNNVTIGDDNNTEYLLSSVNRGDIRVQKAPPSPTGSDNSPTDTDGDGTYEDVTGDRQVNVLDVGALLQNRNSETVQENADAYDYNNDGTVNILDVGRLLRQALAN